MYTFRNLLESGKTYSMDEQKNQRSNGFFW